ncbi:hypothetical protein HKX48_005176 [Thoreauomyces humboldtii]|nr:hypothetical protein HKX48_005176 [Thoreauomyces humboldtii]
MGASDYFSIPAFFVLFRETTEAAILISVLLSFCKQMFGDDPIMYRRLQKQIWTGAALGLCVVLILAAAVIIVFYKLQNDLWSKNELVWEGVLGLIACFVITCVGVIMLKSSRISHQEKWRGKIMAEMDRKRVLVKERDAEGLTRDTYRDEPVDHATNAPRRTFLHRISPRAAAAFSSEKYALFLIPFITILREGIEAVVFVAGVGVSETPKSLPIAVIAGIIVGVTLGAIIFLGGAKMRLKYFFMVSTCFLFIIAAGLFARGIRSLEENHWLGSLLYPSGSGDDGGAPGARYTTALWFLTCCDPNSNSDGWSLFQALAGWSNIGTPASVSGYCMYWVAVIAWLLSIKYVERRRARRNKASGAGGRSVNVARSEPQEVKANAPNHFVGSGSDTDPNLSHGTLA